MDSGIRAVMTVMFESNTKKNFSEVTHADVFEFLDKVPYYKPRDGINAVAAVCWRGQQKHVEDFLQHSQRFKDESGIKEIVK